MPEANFLERIGVVYCPNFEDLLENNETIINLKGLSLVGVEVTRDASPDDLNQALITLKNKNVDALWVLTDSHLLSNDMIQHAWLEQLSRIKLPIVVGAPVLVNEKLPFGVVAVYPDKEALVLQASDLLRIKDLNWQAEGFTLQYPLSVKKKLNLPLAQKWRIRLNEYAAQEVDELIE